MGKCKLIVPCVFIVLSLVSSVVFICFLLVFCLQRTCFCACFVYIWEIRFNHIFSFSLFRFSIESHHRDFIYVYGLVFL